MENKIYSITEAFSMQPRTFAIDKEFDISKGWEEEREVYSHFKVEKVKKMITVYPIIDRIEQHKTETGEGIWSWVVCGFDKDNALLFEYLRNSVNINYY
jgi:hypothetical protein